MSRSHNSKKRQRKPSQYNGNVAKQPIQRNGELQLLQQTLYRSGPLPGPDELKKYAEISPQVLETIISMAEIQQKHRHNIETRQQKIIPFQYSIGQFLGFLITIAIIASGTFLLYNDKNISGFSILLGGGASLIGVYMYGKKQSGKLMHNNNENQNIVDDSENV